MADRSISQLERMSAMIAHDSRDIQSRVCCRMERRSGMDAFSTHIRMLYILIARSTYEDKGDTNTMSEFTDYTDAELREEMVHQVELFGRALDGKSHESHIEKSLHDIESLALESSRRDDISIQIRVIYVATVNGETYVETTAGNANELTRQNAYDIAEEHVYDQNGYDSDVSRVELIDFRSRSS